MMNIIILLLLTFAIVLSLACDEPTPSCGNTCDKVSFICDCVRMRMCMCLFICVCVRMRMCMCLFVCVCVRVNALACLCFCACACASVFMCACVCVLVRTFSCSCACVCVCLCVRACVHVLVCACACMLECVSLHAIVSFLNAASMIYYLTYLPLRSCWNVDFIDVTSGVIRALVRSAVRCV